MTWFKLKKKKFVTTNVDFVTGKWSALAPGRWNEYQLPVVYSADTPETAIAECGIYWVLGKAKEIDNILKTRKKLPKEWTQEVAELVSVEASLAELEVDSDLEILDITNEKVAISEFAKKGFKINSYSELLKHSHLLIENKMTQKFGALVEKGGVQQLIVKSARNPDASCSIFFKNNCSSKAIRVRSVKDVELFGYYQDGTRIEEKLNRLNTITFGYLMDGQQKDCTPMRI